MNPVKNIRSWRYTEKLGWHQICFYCERSIVFPLRKTKDHIVPKSKGGKNSKQVNCVISCHECNQMKGNYSIYEFKERLISFDQTDIIKTMTKNVQVLIELTKNIYLKMYKKNHVAAH